jgi:putative serine protease PepD
VSEPPSPWGPEPPDWPPVSPYRPLSAPPPPPPQTPRARVPWLPILVVTLVVALVGGFVGAALFSLTSVNASSRQALRSSHRSQVVVPARSTIGARGSASPVISVANRVLPSVVSIDVVGPRLHVSGSGFVYDSSGHVVTNNHVVQPAADSGAITVSFANGRKATATIVGRSPSYDLAVLSVDAGAVPPVALGNSTGVQVGQSVVAIGSPLGLDSTVTFGIISATQRPVTAGGSGETAYIDALQTDAAINPGNSGGPLVDLAGRVIGVNSALATVGPTNGEAGNIGVGFAIPIDQVKTTVAQILRTGHAEYPILGVEVSVAQTYAGARVTHVTADSPAQRAGLQVGDVVTKVDGQPVHDGVELIVAIRSYRPGDTVRLSVRRDGEVRPIQVTLGHKVG